MSKKAIKSLYGNYDIPCTLSANSLEDITWWGTSPSNISNDINRPSTEFVVNLVASNFDWNTASKKEKTGGYWSIQESKQHINILETLAVYCALKL